MIAGTSTGGIIALGLTKPDINRRPEYTAEDPIGLYEKNADRIFSGSIWHKIRSVKGFVEEKYPAEEFEGVLDEYFGETRLKEALTDVLITSYEIERRMAWFFTSKDARDRAGYDCQMKKVARATSAAPTYFEPIKIEADTPADYFTLIDGGVFANNPAMCAYVEAMENHKDADDYLVVSIGTGKLTQKYLYEDAKERGLVGWAKPILSIVFDGVDDTVDYQLDKILNTSKEKQKRYFRFQKELKEGNEYLDNASIENIRALKLLAEDLIKEKGDDLESLCDRLTSEKVVSIR